MKNDTDTDTPAFAFSRPEWLRDDLLAEMRRLHGTSSRAGLPQTPESTALWLKSIDNEGVHWCQSEACSAWLTEAGHEALVAIEAEVLFMDTVAAIEGVEAEVTALSAFWGSMDADQRAAVGSLLQGEALTARIYLVGTVAGVMSTAHGGRPDLLSSPQKADTK